MSTAWIFDQQQLVAMLDQFVDDGLPTLRADRQVQADIAARVLFSRAFSKCRKTDPPPSAHGPMLTTGDYSPPKEK